MNTPTEEQMAKLPKWAQDHIKTLERERETAVAALLRHTDEQTPSPISIPTMECIGVTQGPSQLVRYIQPGLGTEFSWEGVKLRVSLADGRSRDKGITLQWESERRGLEHVCMLPLSFQQVQLIAKENMR